MYQEKEFLEEHLEEELVEEQLEEEEEQWREEDKEGGGYNCFCKDDEGNDILIPSTNQNLNPNGQGIICPNGQPSGICMML